MILNSRKTPSEMYYHLISTKCVCIPFNQINSMNWKKKCLVPYFAAGHSAPDVQTMLFSSSLGLFWSKTNNSFLKKEAVHCGKVIHSTLHSTAPIRIRRHESLPPQQLLQWYSASLMCSGTATKPYDMQQGTDHKPPQKYFSNVLGP